MKKVKVKILSIVLAVLALIVCALSFAACADKPGSHEPAPYREANALTKKGVCVSRYNENTVSAGERVNALNPSWYYNWGVKPKNEYIDAEFVPMVWGTWDVTQENLAYIKQNYESGKFTHLLTFNEPDLPDQSNMSVDTALSYWEQLQEIGIPLSSPVVSWYNRGENNDGHPWLDEFMEKAEQRGYRVDFIAVHSYQPYNYPDEMVKSLKEDTLDLLYEKYHKPIWLTEFGAIDVIARDNGWNHLSDGCTEDGAIKYMEKVTDMLEQCPYVERYSWFLDNLGSADEGKRPFEAVYTSLYNDDDTIAGVGEAYAAIKSNVPLYMETEFLPVAKVGNKYNREVLACGGTGGYTFKASGLPAGLTISTSGKISGTPTISGDFVVTITVTDLGETDRVQSLAVEFELQVN